MSAVVAVIGHEAREERRVRAVLRALPERHRRALRAYMDREHVERRDLEAALDAFREEWAA